MHTAGHLTPLLEAPFPSASFPLAFHIHLLSHPTWRNDSCAELPGAPRPLPMASLSLLGALALQGGQASLPSLPTQPFQMCARLAPAPATPPQHSPAPNCLTFLSGTPLPHGILTDCAPTQRNANLRVGIFVDFSIVENPMVKIPE